MNLGTYLKDLAERFSVYIYLLTLFILGFFIYRKSLSYGFILDDFHQVVDNLIVHNPTRWLEAFTGSTISTTNIEGGIYYKPIMTLVYGLIWQFGQEAYGFHLIQLSIHILNSFMVYLFLKKSTQLPVVYCYIVGLLFLCHPINTEAVVFIADLQEPLYTFFGLLGLLHLSSFKSLKSGIFSFFLFLLSMLSKETGFLYLLIGMVYIYIFDKERFKSCMFFAIACISTYLFLRLELASLTSVHSENMRINRITLAERLQTVPKVLIHYIQLFFYPYELSLTQDWFVKEMSLKDFWLPLIFVVLILIACVYLSLKNKHFFFFTLWFLFGWGLHSQIIPLDGTVSDRWFYYTFIGFTASIFLYAHYLSLPRKILVITSLIAISFLSVRSYKRSLNWQNALTLYSHDLNIDPESAYLNNNYALELLKMKQYEAAIPYFEKTISLSPQYSEAWYSGWLNVGASYLFMEDFLNAEKNIKVALQSGSLKSYKAYLMLLDNQGRRDDFINILTTALQRFPNDTALIEIKKSMISN